MLKDVDLAVTPGVNAAQPEAGAGEDEEREADDRDMIQEKLASDVAVNLISHAADVVVDETEAAAIEATAEDTEMEHEPSREVDQAVGTRGAE